MLRIKFIWLLIGVLGQCFSALAQPPDIIKMEYFIDVDPGIGLGTEIPVTAATTQDLTINVPAGSFTEGFHVLTVRAQDQNLEWSVVENKAFFVSQSSTLFPNNITKIEYFIDTDPGRGLGVDVPIASATTVNILENIPTAALSEGFHVVTIRAQDENGLWSLSQNKVFYVNQSSTITINNITKIEYVIGTDPGHGLGVDVPITSAPNFDFLENVPTGSLNEGFHTITVRAQDENGIWSHAENSLVFVSQSSTITQNNITKIEYFIDADPGHNLGVGIPITSAQNFNLLENVPTNTLNEGFHTISVRALDQDLKWSLLESKPFYVSQSSTLSQNQITKLEYFIDADPGHGAATDIPLTSAVDLNILENISTGSLSQGFHVLTLRAQDQNGEWSLSEEKPFYVDRRRQIIAYEYAVDTDPGVGMANLQTIVPPSDSIDVSLSIPTTALALGGHNLIVRILDENNFWSKTNVVPFSLCDGALVDFSASTVCQGSVTDFSDGSTMQAGDIYSWDFDGDGLEDDNTVGDATFTYPSAGVYNAALFVDRSGCMDSVTIAVNVENIPTPIAGGDQDICTDNISLASTAANTGETGTWSLVSGSGVFSNVNDPNATFSAISTVNNQLRWTVVNDLVGCSQFDDVTITSNQPIATAGVDQSLCSDNTTMAATPSNSGETGIWTVVSGSGIFSAINDPNATISGITTPNNQYRWTVTNDLLGCPDFDDILVTSNPINIDAGADENTCTDNIILAASTPDANETGSWSIVSGAGSFSDITDPTATFSGIASYTNQLRWTVTNSVLGCSDFDELIITSNQPITTTPLSKTVALESSVVTDVQSAATINPGDLLTTTLLGQPAKGIANILNDGTIAYAPGNGTVGMDTVDFRLCNQCNNCTDSYLAIDIQNNGPIITSSSIGADSTGLFNIDLLSIISDPNNNLDLSSLRIVQQPTSGAVASINANFVLSVDYTGIVFVGTDEVIIEICDLLGACATSSIFIEVNLPGLSEDPPITVYNAVSPNGDEKHDFLEIENITAYTNNSIVIFNRWGRKVYEDSPYDNDVVKFDGTGNVGGAKELPSGTYFYRLDLGNGIVATGFLVLKN